jgi:hypothetical protein
MKKSYKELEDEEEDASSYRMTLITRGDSGN